MKTRNYSCFGPILVQITCNYPKNEFSTMHRASATNYENEIAEYPVSSYLVPFLHIPGEVSA